MNVLLWIATAWLAMSFTGCQMPWDVQFTPDDVADTLGAIMANPAQYAEEDHPLEDVEAGRVIGKLKNLAGYWGRYEEITGEGVNKYRIMLFEPDAGLLFCYVITEPRIDDEEMSGEIKNPIRIAKAKYRPLSRKRIRVTETEIRSGYVCEEGKIHSVDNTGLFNFPRLESYDLMLTVDGDYLLTQRTGVGQIEPSDSEIELWRRIEIIEEEDEEDDSDD